MADHEFPPLEGESGGFEKRVHQKMADMELNPSDAVWEKVADRLHPKTVTRRWLVWLMFLLGGLCLVGYVFWNSIDRSENNRTSPATKNKIPAARMKEHLPSPEERGFVKRATSAKTVNANQNGISAEKENTTSTIEKTANAISTKKRQKPSDVSVVQTKSHVTDLKPDFPVANEADHHTSTVSKKVVKTSDEADERQNELSSNDQKFNKQKRAAQILGREADEKTASKMETEHVSSRSLEPRPVRSSTISGESINTSFGLVNEFAPVHVASIKLKQRPELSWGFIFAGGKSAAGSGSIHSLFQGSAASFSSNNAFPGGNANLPVPSTIKAGPALKAGLFVKRSLTSRFSISLGLNYNLYTLSNRVGKKVDSSITLAPLFADQKAIEEFFQTGNSQKYTSRYHFIELPVLLHAKFTANEKMPVSLDLGFSLSRLVASNALQYDVNSGIYYNDNSLFNKTHVNLLGGLPIKVFSSDKFSFGAGPYFQYGITNLLSNQKTDGKHFTFIGLKAEILFRKK